MTSVFRPVLVAWGLMVGLVGISAASAQTFPEATARQDVMKGNTAATRVLTPIVRGEQPWNQQVAVQQADLLASVAQSIPTLFPKGSGPEKGTTNALPAIWANFADFEAKAKNLGDEATKLLQLARANDEAGFKAQFPKIGQACGGCHATYRKPLN